MSAKVDATTANVDKLAESVKEVQGKEHIW
jgi:hypothetical protein